MEEFFQSFSLPVSPILKWAGGKKRLIPFISEFINKENLNGHKYFEPFLGSGAVAFHNNFNNMILSDKNKRLINFYTEVRDRTVKLHTEINKYIKEYECLNNSDNKEKFFYDKRDLFNVTQPDNSITSASLFWFLNKTCFNGMYRETKDGKFNIPYGKRECPKPQLNEFKCISEILKHSDLIYGDFKDVCKQAKNEDLIYLDPPYIPISQTASFSSYLGGGFGSKEHYELKDMMANLASNGVKIVMSNSSCKATTKIYGDLKGFKTETVDVRRFISGNAKGRNTVKEILMTNIGV